jgi:hypothetical protein
MKRYTFWSTDVQPKSRSRWSLVPMGVLIGFTLSMPNFFTMSRVYFVWLIKVPSLACLIWNPKKNVRTVIMDNSNLSVIILLNSSQKDLLVEPNIVSSTYIWHTNKSLPIFLVKRVESALPILKPFSIRKSLRHSYHALDAYLSL